MCETVHAINPITLCYILHYFSVKLKNVDVNQCPVFGQTLLDLILLFPVNQIKQCL